MSDPKATHAPGDRCPTCRKPTVQVHRPFCSKRCADIDLARWLGGTFVIPGPALEAADDSGPRPDDTMVRRTHPKGSADD